MKRAPRTALEAKFVANLQTLLPILLGEPEQDDGREYVFHDAVGKVAITYSLDDPTTTGLFIRRHDNFGGAGFDLLELFDLTGDDVAEVFDQLELGETPEPPPVGNNEARSAPVFHEMLATARDDDGRIERYLAGRGLPGMAHHVGLVTMKGGRLGMAAIAVDTVIGDPLALQVLPINSLGRPAAVAGKKVRRTYAAIRGWSRDAAFTLPALEGGQAEVVMCEGTEDALSVRAVGWTGTVVATLGKGNIAHHSPPGTTVILLFDGDVDQHEIDDALEAHRRANRTVRIARLPVDTDPNDMLQAGRGAELLELLTAAEAKESTVVEIEKELLRFPFDEKGRARYMAERRDLSKRFKVRADYLDQVRKRLVEAANPELGDDAAVEIIRDIEPAAHPVDGAELFNKLLDELTALVIFDKEDAERPAGAVATALWVISTHCYEPFPPRAEPDDFFDHAPRLMISAGTIRSGKTRLLETAACLGRRVLRASSLSAAVLFRACEQFRPLVMLDEVDHARLAEDGNALTQLINDGFEPGGAAWRVGGEKNERLDCFRVFTPVALCGIGRLPAATEDRCVRIVLVRKPASRRTARLNKARKKRLRDLAPEILRWVQDSRKVLIQNLEPDFPEGIENDRDEDLWRPLLAIADTIGGEVPALARAAMLELIAIGHEPSVGEELMSAIYGILTAEQVDRPDVTKIALQRLVGLVNTVDGPWAEYRGNMGCDSRWLSKQLKSFDLRWRNVRDIVHGDLPVSGYDILELLKLSGRYRAKEEEEARDLGDEKIVGPAQEKSPTSPTSATDDANALEKQEENGSRNVGGEAPVGRGGPTTANGVADEHDDGLSIPDFLRRSKPSVNPITGTPRKGSVVGRALPTTGSRPTKSTLSSNGKDPDKSNTYGHDVEDVADVGDVGRFSGRGSNTFYSDPIPGIDEPLPIDLTQLDPADLLPGEMKSYGYTVGPAPTFAVVLPPGMSDDDPDAYAQACRLVDDHRMAAWHRFLAKCGGRAMAHEKKPATPRPTPAMIAVAGTAWQGFLASLGVAVKWINSAQELADLAQELVEVARQGETVAIDFETTGDFVAGGIRPRLVQLFAGGDEVAVADLQLTGFAPIACLADVGCVAYGASFEARVFMGQGYQPRLNDAALAAGLRLDRDAFQRDLATTWRRIQRRPTPTNKKAMQRSDFSGELTPEQIAYAASDAIMAFQVWEACQPEARSQPYTVARDAIPAVASMEMAGLGYDRAAHIAIMDEWDRLAENEARRFNELTGLWPKDQKKFREHLQSSVAPDLLETWPRSDKGGLSLSGKTLEHKPQAKLPEVAQYLRAKALGTLITTFGHRMAARVSPITRRLHFGFTLCGARTGRMTSSPNGQNLPAGPYRRIFRAPPGRRMVSLDYSAIELRAAALLAGEKSLLNVFRHPPRLPNGERNPKGDPHEALSATLQLDPVRNAGLRLAKALNFRLLFGTGVEGFAENANITIAEAQELVDRWRRVRSSMVQWQNGTKAAAKRQKYATTPLGRRVNCYDVDPDTKNLRFKPNRSLNVPIQGGCAEALMVALPLAYDGLRGSGLSARLIATVHDEIVFECAEADVEPATAIVHQAMMTGLEKVFGARPRFQDIALYAVGAPKVGQTWDGDAFDLSDLSEKETMVLLKGLVDVDEGEENDEEDEGDDSPKPADPEDTRDELVERIRATTLKLLRQVDARQLRLAFRQAGVELLHKADTAKLADLVRRLSEPLPTDETPEHCRLGPSSAARWLNCPGSIIAIEGAPKHSSVHAHEGHKAHMALEWCLRLDVKPSQIVDPDNWPDVAHSVEVALDYIRRQIGELHVEVRFMIDHDVGLGGTADTVAVNDQEIVVIDFKHGKTAIVVRDNAQLKTYAIGARERFGERKRYRLVIIQPRARRPSDVTEWTVTDAGLERFERQLLTAAKATMQDDVVRRAGAWCQWCPARATCDEYRARQAVEGEQ